MILDYEECKKASDVYVNGAASGSIGGLGQLEKWDGPRGCHIEDGSNFQFNAESNPQPGRRAGHTPVCKIEKGEI